MAAADEEITASGRELFFSGVAAGFAISITFLLYASVSAVTDNPVIGSLLYPLGFLYIIIGGYQLFTENTLPPVALTLERLASLPALLRHWMIVLGGNFAGAIVGAVVLTWGGVFEPAAMAKAVALAEKGAYGTEWWALFYKGVFAGLIVAGVVWVGFASRDTISRVIIVYLAFLAIPLGNLFHVVVSFGEAAFLMFQGDLGLARGLGWFVLPVLLGNTTGGVLLVTVVNYFQTSEDRLASARFEGTKRRLTRSEWAFGRLVGRSYVPLLNPDERTAREGSGYHVMVPLLNPRVGGNLLETAAALVRAQGGGTVHAVHVVQVGERSGNVTSAEQRDRITDISADLLDPIVEESEDTDVEFNTSTVVTHRSFQEVFDTARRTDPDLVLMSWDETDIWEAARTERPLSELANQLPCDFLVARDRDLDVSRVLVPTAGGPDSELSAQVARALRKAYGAEITLLYVVDGPDQREEGEQFLGEWAAQHGLGDASQVIDESGEVEAAIERAAREHTLLILGATERGMLSRLVTGTLHFPVINAVECGVLLAERPSKRSLLQRLIGRGRRDRALQEHATEVEDEEQPATTE